MPQTLGFAERFSNDAQLRSRYESNPHATIAEEMDQAERAELQATLEATVALVNRLLADEAFAESFRAAVMADPSAALAGHKISGNYAGAVLHFLGAPASVTSRAPAS